MLKMGIVMDSIANINIEKDTSFAMLLAAQKRGYELYYMELNDLYLQDGEAWATPRQLTVKQDKQHWFSLGIRKKQRLSDLDVILMRKDPPFDTEYIYATYILERAQACGTLVVNKPQSLRDCNEKLYTAWFPDFTPATLVTRQTELLRQFHQTYGDIILKPLDGMGGASIFRLKKSDPNVAVVIETLTHYNHAFCMAQKYLPEIKDGDKRVLIVGGNVVPYCLARIPQQGETRGNLAAGGTGVVQTLSETDKKIAEHIAPILVEKGLLFVGLDIIGTKLTEINVTSPTCLCQIENAHPNVSITDMFYSSIERLLPNKGISVTL